ncbi:hypothetical protein FYK55_17275 [Roseiconus nitratireducens]|uniref:WD-40 repeat-containing protein n=1 Tax=Roseiconus nitratireducens TaxID=2605748 RepID=A0A5M6D1E8_9BACT|nr:PD40 domain-containing protein [Roseiconus nitratireducens]KAA5541328.1 hypothetical protein FYK55_17275 [Roseiconus nitratireducens]
MAEHTKPVHAVAFSPDGQLLATGARDQIIHLWEVDSGNLLGSLHGHRHAIRSVCFSESGRTLIAGAGDWFDRGEVLVWDVQAATVRHALARDGDAVDWVGHTTSDNEIAVVTGFGCGPRDPVEPTVRLYDVRSGRCRLTFQRENCFAVAPEGGSFAVGGPDCAIKLHRANDGAPLGRLAAAMGNVLCVAFSASGELLLSAGFGRKEQGAVHLWDMSQGTIRRSFVFDDSAISRAMFHSDDSIVATIGSEGGCRFWAVGTGELLGETRESLRKRPNPKSIAISPDGSLLAMTSSEAKGAIELWDLGDLASVG